MSKFPNVFAIAREKNILLGDAFSNTECKTCPISVSRYFNDWEVEKFEIFLSFMNTVQLNASKDKICWTLRKNKSFSVSSLYNNQINYKVDVIDSFPHKII